MESLYSDLHRTGQTLETDASLRLPKRPLGNSNPNPNAFENLGSTLRGASSSSQTQPKSKTKLQRAVSQDQTRPITIKKPLSGFIKKPVSNFIHKPLSDFLDSESDDEIDFLSSPQKDPDDYKPSKKCSTSQPDKCANGDDKNNDYDPKSSFRKSQNLKNLKFTKIKGATDNATIPSSCSFRSQPDLKECEANEVERTPKGKGRQKQPSSSPAKTYPMDMISPLGGKIQKKLPIDKVGPPSSMASRKPKAFPIPSPQTSDKATIRVTSQSKGKNKAKPFPEEGLSTLQKRMTEGRSYNEQQSRKKRRRSLSYVFLCSNFNVVFAGLILLDQT